MIIYIMPLIYILMCKYFRKDNKRYRMELFNKKFSYTYDDLFLMGLFGFLFFLSAFRNYSVGTDTLNYIGHFNSFIDKGYSFLATLDLEIGYKGLMVLASLFKDSRLLIVLVSIIICLGNYIIIRKYSNDYYLSGFLYITLYLFSISLNVQRQAIAMIFIFEYIMSLHNQNMKRSIFFLFLACLFHMTSLFMIVLIPIYYLMNKKELNQYIEELGILLLSFSFFLYDLLLSIVVMIFPKYQFYVEHEVLSNGMVKNEFLLHVLVGCIGLVSLYAFVYKNKKFEYKSYILKYKDYILEICLLVSMVFCITNNRMIGLLYILVLFLHRLRFKNNNKDLLYYSCFIALFILFLQSKMSIFDRLVWYPFALLPILLPQISEKNELLKKILYIISFAFYFRLLLINSCEIIPFILM